jgi:hypothetical protein
VRVVGILVLCACGHIGFDDATTPSGDAAPLSNGLVLHFTFDTSAPLLRDTGSANRDATCTSCPLQIGGRIGDGAASFDGTQCLDIADGLDVRPAQFSLSLWFSSATTSVAVDMMARPHDGATTTMDTFELTWGGGVGNDEVAMIFEGIGPGTAVDIAGWHHVATTYDGALLSLWVDGRQPANPAAVALTYSSDDDLIGCDVDRGALVTGFVGSLDDVRFYNRVLDQSEIQALAAM